MKTTKKTAKETDDFFVDFGDYMGVHELINQCIADFGYADPEQERKWILTVVHSLLVQMLGICSLLCDGDKKRALSTVVNLMMNSCRVGREVVGEEDEQ